jgi:hypothetical protein
MSPELRRRLVGADLLQADTGPSWEPGPSPPVPTGARRRVAQVTEGRWPPGRGGGGRETRGVVLGMRSCSCSQRGS